jgi:hypothetical protein
MMTTTNTTHRVALCRCGCDKPVSYGHGLCWFCYWNGKRIPQATARKRNRR